MLSGTSIVQWEKVFKTIFNQATAEFANLNIWTKLGSLATEVPSDGAEEDYRWLGALPVFREWIGESSASELADYSYTIKNKHFQAGVDIDSDELNDDKLGIIKPRIQFLAVRALQHRGKQIEQLILNGGTNLAYDGVAFISDASGVRVNDNLGTGYMSAATPTVALAEQDLDTLRYTMMQFVDDKGEMLGLVPNIILCHPSKERIYRTVISSSADPAISNSGAANGFKGMWDDVIPLPSATDLNDVYGICTTMPVKPFVFQNRQETDQWLDDSLAKRNRIYRFGADYRAGFGYSLPQLAVKLVSAVA